MPQNRYRLRYCTVCLSVSQCGVWWLKHRGHHSIVQNSADIFFVWKSGSWKHLVDGNRKTLSWRRKPGKHLQLLQIPLAIPVFHNHPAMKHELTDHAAGLPHKSATNILRPVKLPVWNRFTSRSKLPTTSKSSNNHRHLSLRTAKNLSLNLKAGAAELRSFNLEYPRMSPPQVWLGCNTIIL